MSSDHAAARSYTGRRTLLSKILIWIFGPLFLLWTIGIVITYFIAQHIANSPYDRSLQNQLELLQQEVSNQSIHAPIRLSESARTIFRLGTSAPIYWQIRNDDGEALDGNAPLSMPDNWEYDSKHVHFTDGNLRDQRLRLAYAWGAHDQAGATYLAVVAESNAHRRVLHHEILIGMLTPQFILVPLAALLAGLGLTHGLEPLNALQARIRRRAAHDLSPIDGEQAPSEIVPLIAAMNDLLQRQAASSAAQRRFVANAAHQLKTPLAGIRTQVELALKQKEAKTSAHTLEQLLRGTDRATRLVNQMLMLAKAEGGELANWQDMTLIELNALAEQQLGLWVSQAMHKNIDLGLETNTEPALIRGDGFMLGEMLNNLLDNALLYTPPGGTVTLRVGTDTFTCWLEVEDSGPGIAAQYKHKVFDRFYRILGADADGSGLGLAIVKEIADMHQAEISFVDQGPTPATGSGTCIRVKFPSLERR